MLPQGQPTQPGISCGGCLCAVTVCTLNCFPSAPDLFPSSCCTQDFLHCMILTSCSVVVSPGVPRQALRATAHLGNERRDWPKKVQWLPNPSFPSTCTTVILFSLFFTCKSLGIRNATLWFGFAEWLPNVTSYLQERIERVWGQKGHVWSSALPSSTTEAKELHPSRKRAL